MKKHLKRENDIREYTIEEIISDCHEASDMCKWLYDFGVLDVSGYKTVHMTPELFLRCFEEYDIEQFESDMYDTKLSTVSNGVEYFCIANEDEL